MTDEPKVPPKTVAQIKFEAERSAWLGASFQHKAQNSGSRPPPVVKK